MGLKCIHKSLLLIFRLSGTCRMQYCILLDVDRQCNVVHRDLTVVAAQEIIYYRGLKKFVQQ